MRRAAMCLMLSVLMLSQIGCILAVEVKDWPHDRQVIEIDGEMYLVNLRTNKMRKVTPEYADDLEDVTRIEYETTGE